MQPRRSRTRWSAVSGLIFVVAWIVGLLLEPSAPGPTASSSQLTAYYLAHQGGQIAQSYLIDGIAGVALLVFAAALRAAFPPREDENATLARVIFGAGIAAASVSLVQAALGETLANRGVLADAAAVGIVFVTLNNADTFKMLALALLAASATVLILRTQALPGWLAWLGIVLTLTLIVGGLSFPLASAALYVVLYVALPLLLIWIGALSIVLLRRS